MQIHEFNTNREYTPQGQRIRYVITNTVLDTDFNLTDYTVIFHDTSRNITGETTLYCIDSTKAEMYLHIEIKEALMRAYDTNSYTRPSNTDFEQSGL